MRVGLPPKQGPLTRDQRVYGYMSGGLLVLQLFLEENKFLNSLYSPHHIF